MNTFEKFTHDVLSLLKLPGSYAEPNTGHNLSVVLCHVQTLAAIDINVDDIKMLGATKKEEVAALAVRGANPMNSLMVGTHAKNFIAKGAEDPRDFDLAPGATPGTVVLVLRGGPGALDAPSDLVEVALNIAHADNASNTSKSLLEKPADPGKVVKGTVKTIVPMGRGKDFVEHIFEASKIWWTKTSRFEEFALFCCKAFKFGAPSPSNLKKVILKIEGAMEGGDLNKAVRKSRQRTEAAMEALTAALVASGLIAIAEAERNKGTLNPYTDGDE